MNKKGEPTQIMWFVMGAALIALVLVFNTSLFGKTNKQIDPLKKFSCGNTIIGEGTCEESCEDYNTRFEGFGCPKDDAPNKKVCCIKLESGQSKSTGGNYTVNFDPVGIDLSDNSKNSCTTTDTYKYVCPSNVELKVNINNSGQTALKVFASPRIVNENTKIETFPFGRSSELIKSGEKKDTFVMVTLQKGVNKIFSGGKCIDDECAKENILRINNNNYIYVTIN